jgi:single-strand DNA-binding protein
MSLNSVSLTGRLTKEVDLRYTSNGTAVGTFTLAVDRQFKNAQGEKETDFVNAVIWKKSAEALANYTRKGSLIGITGRIQTRNYENQQGQRVFVTEVVAENFTFLESKNSQNNAPQGNNSNWQGNNQGGGNNRTQGNYNAESDPFMSSGQNISIDPDDLPF